MSEKNQEPKRDFGFYATVPRIVRTQYPKLSHTEKWLYVCLKDLCGDKGTCFRTLRSLSEETDISIASLSKMIPNLHKYGLIHAEKKRRTESGKEVWHITIADIWSENAKVCSKNKQSASEVVQNTNNVVQNLNENTGDCSENERDCSNFVDRGKNTEARTFEERTEEERTNGARQPNVSTSDSSSIHSSNFSSSFSSQEKPQIVLTEDEQRIVDFGKKDIFKAVKPQVTQKLKDECAELAPHIKTQEQFDSLLAYVKGKLKPPYHLKNMVNALNDWLQTQEKKPLKVKDLATRPFRDLGAYQREIERQYYEKQAAIAKKKAEQAGC